MRTSQLFVPFITASLVSGAPLSRGADPRASVTTESSIGDPHNSSMSGFVNSPQGTAIPGTAVETRDTFGDSSQPLETDTTLSLGSSITSIFSAMESSSAQSPDRQRRHLRKHTHPRNNDGSRRRPTLGNKLFGDEAQNHGETESGGGVKVQSEAGGTMDVHWLEKVPEASVTTEL